MLWQEEIHPYRIAATRRLAMSNAMLTLGANPDDLLSTCIYACVTPCGAIIHVEGDGVVAFKDRESQLRMVKFDWLDNIPFYPARLLSQSNLDRFISDHGGDPNAKRLFAERFGTRPGLPDFEQSQESYTLSEGIDGVTFRISTQELDRLEYIAIFSDGVDQVEGEEWTQVVTDLLSFKNTEGEFFKRRMNAAGH